MLETTFSNTPLPLITAHDSSSAPSRLISMLSIWLTISLTFLGVDQSAIGHEGDFSIIYAP